MIHCESSGSFVFVTPSNQRIDVDLDFEHTPEGCCTISAGHIASQVTLNASDVRELIVELTKVAKILERKNATRNY